jgi:hypothetical protein
MRRFIGRKLGEAMRRGYPPTAYVWGVAVKLAYGENPRPMVVAITSERRRRAK